MKVEKDADFPEYERAAKVVQLELDGEKFCVFDESMAHWCILEDFLQEKNIPYENVKIHVFDRPALQGSRYHVDGMGWYMRFRDDKYVQFYGNSHDYKIGTSKEYADLLQELNPDWEIAQE